MWANIGNGAVVNLALFERIDTLEDKIVGTYADGRQLVLASVDDGPDRRSKIALYDRRVRAVMNDGVGIADLAPEAHASARTDDRPEKPFYVPDR